MPSDYLLPNRQSIRLKGYDYSQPGYYLITLCTYQRAAIFGTIHSGKMVLNNHGELAKESWMAIPSHFPGTHLDAFVIMPNHIHGIIIINGNTAKPNAGSPEAFGKPVPGSLPTIIRSFKAATTFRINKYRESPGSKVWQRNYWERVIRNGKELDVSFFPALVDLLARARQCRAPTRSVFFPAGTELPAKGFPLFFPALTNPPARGSLGHGTPCPRTTSKPSPVFFRAGSSPGSILPRLG